MKECGWRGAVGAASLVALLGAAALAADETAMIKTPQKVRIQFSNGKTYGGTLLSLTEKEIEFQAAGTARAARYKVELVKAIQTIDDVYVYNADKGVFESQKAKGGKDGAAEVKKGPDAAASGLQVVAADGVAEKAEAAVAQAQRAAVRQVVRSMLGGSTFNEAEKTIEEKVLAGSDRLVKGRRLLARTKEEGKERVRLAVAVDRRAVASRLKEAGLKVKTGPRGVGTELATAEEIKAHGAEAISEVLADVPLTLVGDARIFGVEEETQVRLEVRLGTDLEAYAQVVGRLHKVLEVLGSDRQSLGVVTQEAGPELGRRRSAAVFAEGFPGKRDGWVLWTVSETDPEARKMLWHKTLVNTDFQRSISSLAGRQYLLMSVLGPGGQVAGTELVPLEPERVGYLSKPWHKWGWADCFGGHPARDTLFVTPVGLSLYHFKGDNVLDCIPQRKQLFVVNISGIAPQQITGAQCALVLLPK